MKIITKLTAYSILITQLVYFAVLMGTFAHELNHAAYDSMPGKIVIQQNGEGYYYHGPAMWAHSHEFVYFNGNIVMLSFLIIDLLCISILVKSNTHYKSHNKS